MVSVAYSLKRQRSGNNHGDLGSKIGKVMEGSFGLEVSELESQTRVPSASIANENENESGIHGIENRTLASRTSSFRSSRRFHGAGATVRD